jgi:MFS family permease
MSWILMDFAGELPGIYYSDYVIQLGGTATILGLIMLVSQLVLASVQFPGGFLADKYGRRWLISTLTFGVALSYIWYAIAPSWHFILFGAIMANFCLLYQPALLAMMMDSLPPERRGVGYSIINLIMSVATTPAPAVAMLLISNFGPVGGMRVAYAVVTMFFLAAAILRIRLKESIKNPEKIRLREVLNSYPKAVKEGIGVWKQVPRSALSLLFGSLLARFSFTLTGLYFLIYAIYVLQIGGPPTLGLDPDPAIELAYIKWGLVMLVLFATMIILAFPCGKLIDKVGRKIPLLLSTLLIVPSVLLFVYGNYATLFIVMPLVGFSQLLAFSAFQALFADLVPQEKRGKAIGSMNFFTYIFMAFGALAGGVLYDTVSPQFPFLLMIVLVIPQFLLILFFVHEPERRED